MSPASRRPGKLLAHLRRLSNPPGLGMKNMQSPVTFPSWRLVPVFGVCNLRRLPLQIKPSRSLSAKVQVKVRVKVRVKK